MCVSISRFDLENGREPTHFTFKYLFFEIRKKKTYFYTKKRMIKLNPDITYIYIFKRLPNTHINFLA